MTRPYATVNLTQSLEIFEDILDDISDAMAINLTAKLEELPPPKLDDVAGYLFRCKFTEAEDLKKMYDSLKFRNEIRKEVHKLEVEAITTKPLKVIRRIASRKYYQTVEGQANSDRITDDDIARAKESPIEDMYDGQLRASGGKQWGACPFHNEKTASFFVDEDNRWRCFGACGTGGDSIDFIQKREGISFIQAVKSLVR
jgi:hypothetical protein